MTDDASAGAATGARPTGNMKKLTAIVAELPEWERVDIEAWGGEPTFRVRKKNFVFANHEANVITFKLSKDEAEAVVGADDACDPCGYGLGRHGWVTARVPSRSTAARWREIREWVRTSYTLVAPRKLARVVLAEDGADG